MENRHEEIPFKSGNKAVGSNKAAPVTGPARVREFERLVTEPLSETEDQIKEALRRADATILEMEMRIAVAENNIALSLDPRYLEESQKLKMSIAECNELVGKICGIESTTI